ncbi:MAG: NAD-dependent epimerase/dehydratase family protein [Anaerolineae bacterium]
MIVVTGATGFVGRGLVPRLMKAGYPVRCLLPAYKNQNLPWDRPPEIISGGLLDEEVLFKTVTGAHTIIHLESAQWWGTGKDLERIEIVGTRNLISAARSARVGRIIAVSQLGASMSSAYTLLRVKGIVEEIIRTSGLAYTIIRSGVLFGEEDVFVNHIAMMLRATPLFYLMPGQGEAVLHPLYIADLVEALVLSLELVDTLDKVMDIGGPEYITLQDLIYTVMRVSGVNRTVVPIPPYLLRWITSVYGRVFRRSLMTPQWLDILATNRTAPLGNIYNYFGINPRRFEDTLLTYMPKKRYWWPMIRFTLRRRPHSA